MKKDRTNLNHLVVLNTLLEECHVGKTAERMNLSQPAVSHVLKQLRLRLNDPLLVRGKHCFEPSNYAKAIQEELHEVIDRANALVKQKQPFDSKITKRNFAVGSNDIGEICILPHVVHHLDEINSNISLNWTKLGSMPIGQAVDNDEVCLAIVAEYDVPQHLHSVEIGQQNYVCISNKSHPIVSAKDKMSAYFDSKHVMIKIGERNLKNIQAAEKKLGKQRKVQIRMNHNQALPYVLGDTGLLATIPESLAKNMCSNFKNLVITPTPFEVDPINVLLVWHARYNQDPGHIWLRELASEAWTAWHKRLA